MTNLSKPQDRPSPQRPLRMEILYHPVVLDHQTGMHPESAKRLDLFQELRESELYDGAPWLDLVHSPAYIERVKRTSAKGGSIGGGTVVSPGSYRAASYAVGATVAASERGDFALVRPPGHHAHADHTSGFCVFNSVAIAARRLVEQGKRVLIFDFDGHHGDGTAAIFYDSPDVMVWSVHQYPAFPGTGSGDEVGKGEGEGFTLNTPLPPGSADDIFLDAIDHFLPIARAFDPDVVALSAGFDGHQYDLLLDLKLSTGAFYRLGRKLDETFDQLFATLEGGYNVSEMPKSVYGFLAGINDLPNPYPNEPKISGLRVWETYEMLLHAGLGKLKTYWEI